MEADRNRGPEQTPGFEAYRYAELPWKRYPKWLDEFRAHCDPEQDGYPGRNPERRAEAVLEPYRFQAIPGAGLDWTAGDGDGQVETEAVGTDSIPAATVSEDALARERFFQQLLAAETAKARELGRSEGLKSGVAEGREEAERALESQRDRLFAQASALAESFAESQEGYLHRLEQESARLALAIAARILRREAQADPLLLTGAIRVALGQLAATTEVRLHVPSQDEAMWREALSRMPGPALRPSVIGEAEMGLGECRLETELGSADLGLWAQLKTMERGFFERPGESAPREPEGWRHGD